MPSGSQIAHSTLWPQGVNLLLEYLFYAQPGLCSGEPRGADGGPAPPYAHQALLPEDLVDRPVR
jgi:hypothetical protein